jgi:hypothetical protein
VTARGKAVVVRDRGSALAVEDLHLSEVGPGQVRVRVRAVGVCPFRTVATNRAVTGFSIIRMGTATRSVDTDQRRIALTPTAVPGGYCLSVPGRPGRGGAGLLLVGEDFAHRRCPATYHRYARSSAKSCAQPPARR